MKDYSIWYEGMVIGYLSERGMRATSEKQALKFARQLFTDPDNKISVKVM